MIAEAIDLRTELQQAFDRASTALRAAFSSVSGISVSPMLSEYQSMKLSWSVTAFAPSYFNGTGETIEEAIEKAIAAGRLVNAKRCNVCDGFADKCGHSH